MSNRGILDADMTTLTGWLGTAWRWWLAELAELVPQTWRDRATARRKLADYRPETGEILLRYDPERGYPASQAPVAVIIPQALCLTRTIERPLMSQSDLESMIALECDRILPLARDEAVLAARIVARNDERRRMTVEVAAIPRAAADDLAAALGRLSRPCLAVHDQTPEPARQPPVDFLPAMRRAGLVGATSKTAAGLWLALGALVALNIGVLIWQDVASVDALSQRIAEQQPGVSAARRIEARIARSDSLANLTRAQRQRSEPLALIGTITGALPEGVWLQRLTWSGDSVRITGYRPGQADVSAALRRAGFAVTRYSETAAIGPGKFGQPFEITLRLRKP